MSSPSGKQPSLGAVYTRPWVTSLILDLANYTPENRLFEGKLLEPAVGDGAFLKEAVERLIRSADSEKVASNSLGEAIRAYDIDHNAVRRTRRTISKLLIKLGVDQQVAKNLSTSWILRADFLTLDSAPEYNWVVGNPPYVRIEEVDKERLAQYRAKWQCMKGRSDLYIAFLEAGLAALAPGGTMATICTDRWMRNTYGSSLRSLVSTKYSMDACIALHGKDAFEEEVHAYPAITVIRRQEQGPVLFVDSDEMLGESDAQLISDTWKSGAAVDPLSTKTSWLPHWYANESGWPSGSPDQLQFIANAERCLPTLTEAGVSVGMGPATGADRVYFVSSDVAIEPSRRLKAVSAKDLVDGAIKWDDRYVLNPWTARGVVDLPKYPKLEKYLIAHKARLLQRSVAKSHPATWWRTIDRIRPELASSEKLLIPDIKNRIAPVLDRGVYIPMHNLYYVTAPDWDIEVLGGLLMSETAFRFIRAYSVRMASGYYRVSAQYLRKLRIPQYKSIHEDHRSALREAFANGDTEKASIAARTVYELALS